MDLYGRGYSDGAHKDTVYDHRLFVSLLAEVLLLLREETQGLSVLPIHLIGYRCDPAACVSYAAHKRTFLKHQPYRPLYVPLTGPSMGGGVVAAFADRFPRQTASLTLVAPSGLPVDLPFTARLLSLPGMGEIMFNVGGRQSLMKHMVDGAITDREMSRFICFESLPSGRSVGHTRPSFPFPFSIGYAVPSHESAQKHCAKARERLQTLFDLHPGGDNHHLFSVDKLHIETRV